MELNPNTIQWLLEENNPPVRRKTLIELLGKPENSPEVSTSSANLNDYPPIQTILSHWRELWTVERKYPPYKKYEGGYWNFIFLGDMGADGSDERIKSGAEYLLSLRTKNDLFAWDGKSQRFGICLSANILRAMLKMGFGNDVRVITGLESLAGEIVSNKGIRCEVMDYSLLPDCFMALPQTLTCLTSIPQGERSAVVNEAIGIISSRLLEREVFVYVPSNAEEWRQHSWNISRGAAKGNVLKTVREEKKKWLAEGKTAGFTEKDSWKSFGFPLHYNPDLLEAMLGLTAAGIEYTPSLKKALDLIESKADPEGRWKLARTLNGKMLTDIEEKGKPSKWVTLRASMILKSFGRIKIA